MRQIKDIFLKELIKLKSFKPETLHQKQETIKNLISARQSNENFNQIEILIDKKFGTG
jgi:hypothetical protein